MKKIFIALLAVLFIAVLGYFTYPLLAGNKTGESDSTTDITEKIFTPKSGSNEDSQEATSAPGPGRSFPGRAHRHYRMWDPFRELEEMQERMNRIFEESFARFDEDFFGMFEPLSPSTPGSGTNVRRHSFSMRSFSPSMDVYRDSDSIMVKVDLPGLTKKDVNLKISGNTLTVWGERKNETTTTKDNYYSREVRCGSFSRQVVLPDNIIAEKATAKMENGVLLVTIPVDKNKSGEVNIKVE